MAVFIMDKLVKLNELRWSITKHAYRKVIIHVLITSLITSITSRQPREIEQVSFLGKIMRIEDFINVIELVKLVIKGPFKKYRRGGPGLKF